MDNLYFIPNNILTNFFKELTKKKKKKRLSIAFFLASPTKTHAFIIIKSQNIGPLRLVVANLPGIQFHTLFL